MPKKKRMSEYVKADYDKFVTWNQKADAAHAVEQGVRAIERFRRRLNSLEVYFDRARKQ